MLDQILNGLNSLLNGSAADLSASVDESITSITAGLADIVEMLKSLVSNINNMANVAKYAFMALIALVVIEFFILCAVISYLKRIEKRVDELAEDDNAEI